MNTILNQQPAFGARFYVPGKNNTTVRFNTTGKFLDLTRIDYDVLHKGKVLERKAYQNKKGFNDERLASICEEIQSKIKEGFDFLDEMFKAQFDSH